MLFVTGFGAGGSTVCRFNELEETDHPGTANMTVVVVLRVVCEVEVEDGFIFEKNMVPHAGELTSAGSAAAYKMKIWRQQLLLKRSSF